MVEICSRWSLVRSHFGSQKEGNRCGRQGEGSPEDGQLQRRDGDMEGWPHCRVENSGLSIGSLGYYIQIQDRSAS